MAVYDLLLLQFHTIFNVLFVNILTYFFPTGAHRGSRRSLVGNLALPAIGAGSKMLWYILHIQWQPGEKKEEGGVRALGRKREEGSRTHDAEFCKECC